MRLFYLSTFLVLLIGLSFLGLQWRAHIRQQKTLQRVTRLIRQFKSPDARRRATLRKELMEIGEPAISPLVEALQNRNALIWRGAAETLHAIGAPAVEPLSIALRDKEFKGRDKAASVLGVIGKKTGHTRVVRALISVLDDDRSKEQRVDANAALALTQIGKAAVKPLIAALDYKRPYDDRNLRTRSWAATILGALGDRRTADPMGKSPDGVDAHDRQLIFEALRQALADNTSAIRSNAARALGSMHDARCLPPLVEALNDRQPTVRKAAVEALGDLGDPAAIPILQLRAHDLNEDEQVKIAAFIAIQYLRQQRK